MIEQWRIIRRLPQHLPGPSPWHVAQGPDPGDGPEGVMVVPAAEVERLREESATWQRLYERQVELTERVRANAR